MNRAGRLKRHQKACAGKRKFTSRDAANTAIDELARTGAVGGQRQPYKCLACTSWHFGHIPRSQGRRHQ